VRPLAIDLYCGLGGWTSGLQAAGWDVIGWDIERHAYDGERYPGQLVLGDVRALHGSQFKTAGLIVGSSPCTEYSYMAMPWSRAKAKAAAIRADETGEALRRLNELFDAQFRIQREASEAAGRHIPLVVENVKGAQPWVGRARGSFGSYYLWGDLPALMPTPTRRGAVKVPGMNWSNFGKDDYRAVAFNDEAVRQMDGRKVPGFRFDGSGRSFQTASVEARLPEGRKNGGGSWFMIGSPGQAVTGQNPDGRLWKHDPVASCGSRSPKRKAASAKIAKIPFPLAHWIGRTYLPDDGASRHTQRQTSPGRPENPSETAA
jgi:hypothetical protein